MKRQLGVLVLVAVAVMLLGVRPSHSADPVTKAKQHAPTAKRVLGNAGLTAQVKSALLADKVAPGMQINVNSNGGVVTLIGKVDTTAQRTRAVQVTRKVKGVKKVVNKLTVKAGTHGSPGHK